MTARRMRIEAPCPACAEREMDYTTADLDIPYFGNVTQLIFECNVCGFRHSDFLTASHLKPTRYVYKVTKEDDMTVRVVRSTSGTVRIPELGVLIEPGPASDAYVSNIEGVLVRIERVLGQLRRDAEDEATRRECDRRMDDLLRAKRGQFALTFILEDPYGNSLVAAAEVEVQQLSDEEASSLKTGDYTLRLKDSREEPEPSNGVSGNGHKGPPEPPA